MTSNSWRQSSNKVVAIFFGIIAFGTPVTPASALGVLLTCAGIVWYTMASYNPKPTTLNNTTESDKSPIP
jgi:drug/metabolite transporter (DMT)-like permease